VFKLNELNELNALNGKDLRKFFFVYPLPKRKNFYIFGGMEESIAKTVADHFVPEVVAEPLTEADQLALFGDAELGEVKELPSRHSGSRRARFLREYVILGNATEAAIRAGYSQNRESARRIGSRLLSNVDIKSNLAFFQREIEIQSLVKTHELILNVMEDRELARTSNKGRPNVGDMIAADRTLMQVLGMLTEKHEVIGGIPVAEVPQGLGDLLNPKKSPDGGEAG
jgi:phage terminase small subunit